MKGKVGIIGVGYEGFRPAVTDISTRELMYQAASKAYDDAGVDPRRDIGSFICCTEDLWEGWSIADEMVPDQVGGARRPVCTIPGDGIIGLGHAVMHIRAGVADVVSVEAHSKVADVLDKQAVENLGLDPVYQRVVGANSDVLAGLEMSAFMSQTGFTRDDASLAVVAEKKTAMSNGRASYGAVMDVEEVGKAEPVATPLRRFDRCDHAECGVVLVLASEKWIRKNRAEAVSVDGVAWRSSTPWHEGGGIARAKYAQDCFKSVLEQSGAKGIESFDMLEVDDTYSYKLLQHLVSLGVGKEDARRMLRGKGQHLNPSGGSLGCGYMIEATGSHRVLECVLQMRGKAGGNQISRPENAAVLSWRGNPTGTGAAIGLSVGA